MKAISFVLLCAIGGSVGLSSCAVESGQSTVGQYVDDTTITTRVKTRFAEDKDVSEMRINVQTLRGVVQLAGFATSETEKNRAAAVAQGVPGVQSVKNDIIVRAPS
jgi:osmotically-inducible protein OsmY